MESSLRDDHSHPYLFLLITAALRMAKPVYPRIVREGWRHSAAPMSRHSDVIGGIEKAHRPRARQSFRQRQAARNTLCLQKPSRLQRSWYMLVSVPGERLSPLGTSVDIDPSYSPQSICILTYSRPPFAFCAEASTLSRTEPSNDRATVSAKQTCPSWRL